MTLSNHRRIELHGIVAGKEPDRIRVLSGCVLMIYGSLSINVSRRTWRVTVPGNPDMAAFLESLGVGDRAKLAAERGEGVPRPILSDECLRQRARLVATQAALRLRLACVQ